MPTIALSKLFPDVYETDDFLVYEVASSKPGVPPYRVDMQKFCGAGDCPCLDFTTRKRKQLIKRAMPSEALECKHIRRAGRYIRFKITNEAIERREHQAEQNKKARRLDIGLSKTASSVGQTGRAAPAEQTGDWPEDSDIPF